MGVCSSCAFCLLCVACCVMMFVVVRCWCCVVVLIGVVGVARCLLMLYVEVWCRCAVRFVVWCVLVDGGGSSLSAVCCWLMLLCDGVRCWLLLAVVCCSLFVVVCACADCLLLFVDVVWWRYCVMRLFGWLFVICAKFVCVCCLLGVLRIMVGGV